MYNTVLCSAFCCLQLWLLLAICSQWNVSFQTVMSFLISLYDLLVFITLYFFIHGPTITFTAASQLTITITKINVIIFFLFNSIHPLLFLLHISPRRCTIAHEILFCRMEKLSYVRNQMNNIGTPSYPSHQFQLY